MIEAAGPMTTLQDLGRFGAQALGVPVAGALDRIGLRAANALVGNPPGTACLEMRLTGPAIRVVGGPVRIALAGTEAPLNLSGDAPRAIPSGRSVRLNPGDVFRVGAITDTSCAYLAAAGGFAVAPTLESLSTYAAAGIGGLAGRPLRDGDEIPLNADAESAGDLCLADGNPYGAAGPIRIVLGPQADFFTAGAIETFLSAEYRLSHELDRMGARLQGPRLTHAAGFNIASDGIVTGSIQVPGSGQPIVLLADRQTTGGYPKIGTVISADIPRFARLMPGAPVRFAAVRVAEAEALRRQQEEALAAYVTAITPLRREGQDLYRRLMSCNLISGVTAA